MLKIVDLLVNDKQDKDVLAFTKPTNRRDIFLNISSDKRYHSPNQVGISIHHEAIHNTLSKHIDEKTSKAFDNLFIEKIQDILDIKLNIHENIIQNECLDCSHELTVHQNAQTNILKLSTRRDHQ